MAALTSAQFLNSFNIGVTLSALNGNLTPGAASIPSMGALYTFGATGDFKVNKLWYVVRLALAAGADDTYDLSSGLTLDGTAVAFTGVKEVVPLVIGPNGTKKIRLGNAGSNSWQGPLSAAATFDVIKEERWSNPYGTGTPVDGTHKNLNVHNPTGSAVDYVLIVLGVG